MYLRLMALAAAACIATLAIAAEKESEHGLVVTRPDKASITKQVALEAWDRIHEVASHPRCSNCHVGADNTPMWSGPSYGETRPHGMGVNAGESRIGAETVPCSTCHITRDGPNEVAHAAPHLALPWRLAPVEFAWFGRSSEQICAQMRDPERNGGRDERGLVEHIVFDAEHVAFIFWGFNPGGGREPAPGTLQEHLDDMVVWVAGGMPCPGD